MKTLKQICKEFWLPFILALIWSFYNLHTEKTWAIAHAVNIFGAAFFLVSWCSGQYFRIRKQNKLENEFDKINSQIDSFYQQLEDRSEKIIGNLTGGDSFCYWFITNINLIFNNGLELTAHSGKYPLLNVQARIVDMDKVKLIKDANFNDMQACTVIRSFGSLLPNHSFMRNEIFDLGNQNERSFNIFWTANNGSFDQLLRYRKIGDEWCWATKVTRNEILLYEKIHANFPKNEFGEIEW